MIELTKENFDEIIRKKPTLVDFWAPWCAPCKALTLVLEEVDKSSPKFQIGKINIDEQPELGQRFDIRSIPTLIFFKNGIEIVMYSGERTKDAILKWGNNEAKDSLEATQ